MKSLQLHAQSLASKFGFMDGDIVSLFCEENNIESELKDKDSHDVLIKLVRKHLLPLVSHVEVFEISTMHNPIRCEDDSLMICVKAMCKLKLASKKYYSALKKRRNLND